MYIFLKTCFTGVRKKYKRTVNARFAAPCLSTGKPTVMLSERAGNPGSYAVDNANYATYSCTDNTEGIPWIVIDLEAEYLISEIILTLPNVGGDDRNYRRSCYVFNSLFY